LLILSNGISGESNSNVFCIYLRGSKWWQNVVKLELFMVLLPALHHQLISIRFAVAIPVVHVLGIRSRMGEALQALTTLEGFLARMETFVLGLREEKSWISIERK
jgi:hypothetical protein